MQVKTMQAETQQLASNMRPNSRTIAQKKRDLIAQVERMALADLDQLSGRLKALHRELEQGDGRRWTYYQLAEATGIPHRTWQSWESGEVENRDGRGYDKMARFYTKKLGRKITRQWILFGVQETPEPLPQATPATAGELKEAASLAELRAELAAVRIALEETRSKLETVLRSLEAGNN